VDFKTPLRRFDAFQVRRAWLAVPVATIKKFADDEAGRLAAVVAYYAFFSLFPLLLVFVTLLGFVLSSNPSALESVKDSVLGRFPIIGQEISNNQLEGSGVALAVGIVVSLFAGLGVTQAAGYALDHIWDVPRKERAGFISSRLHGLGLLFLIGGLFLIASVASGIVTSVLSGGALQIFPIAVSIALNFAVFMMSFRLLCSERLTLAWLAPGAALAALAWSLLQLVGTNYIRRVAHSHNAYGTFALTIGLLAWLYLGAQVTTYAAELNVVLARRLWPRRLFSSEDQQHPGQPGQDQQPDDQPDRDQPPPADQPGGDQHAHHQPPRGV
jgi:YihY family inner membrane protein